MSVWTTTKPPHFAQNAYATNNGWTIPATKAGRDPEVIIAIGGLLDNQGAAAFSAAGYSKEGTFLKVGDTVTFYAYFNALVTVTGTPQLVVSFNAQSRTINYSRGTGTNRLEFDYTIAVGDDCAATQFAITALNLNSGTIVNSGGANNGSAATRTVPTRDLDHLSQLLVDATAPTISSGALTFSGSSSNVLTGDVITLTFTMSSVVRVVGAPQVAMVLDSGTVQMPYVSGDGTTALVFQYTVQSGDNVALGNATFTSPFALNSGTVKDVNGNAAVRTFSAPTGATGFGVNTAEATLVALAAGPAFVTGNHMDFTVTWNKAVTVTGSPQIALTVHLNTRQAVYLSGSGTTALVFRYDAVSGDVATAGQVSLATTIALNSGTVKDAGAVNASLKIPAVDLSLVHVN